MTEYKPTLSIKRLRIERLNKEVYDEPFHPGVNILRGDNSSGKSTVLNFLYYSIGGDVTDWSPTAILCTRVLVEVLLNGKVATLARDISNKSGQPMDIFGGTIDEALVAPSSNWSRYPYRRSETRESFSQQLFGLLGVPEASNDASGNVTIHQMLRLMYADQLSPVGTLFKFEQFDPPLLRDSVGRLIFGAYQNELYSNELQIRDLSKEHAEISSKLSAIRQLLSYSGQILTPAWLVGEQSRLVNERQKIEEQIIEAERLTYEDQLNQKMSLEGQRRLYDSVQSVQAKIQKVKEEIDTCKFEIADAARFIADLESKLISLNDSSSTSNVFGKITFQYCPACYSPMEQEHPVHACHLCKNPLDNERSRSRIVAIINDTTKQLNQSRALQKDRKDDLASQEENLKVLMADWKSLSVKLTQYASAPTSASRENLRSLQRNAGYIDRQLEDLIQKQVLSSTLEELISKKALLNAEITRLSERNEGLKLSLSKRLNVAYMAVEKEILTLLHNDLPREQAFINAQTVQFDFSANKLSVDNETYFSASSRVILRNSFFVGLFAAATQDASFRHFRLCILDSIEDKGMQVDRSHNFQRMVVNASQRATANHQIIFATSMIAPELDRDELVVGHYSTLEDHTLKILS